MPTFFKITYNNGLVTEFLSSCICAVKPWAPRSKLDHVHTQNQNIDIHYSNYSSLLYIDQINIFDLSLIKNKEDLLQADSVLALWSFFFYHIRLGRQGKARGLQSLSAPPLSISRDKGKGNDQRAVVGFHAEKRRDACFECWWRGIVNVRRSSADFVDLKNI